MSKMADDAAIEAHEQEKIPMNKKQLHYQGYSPPGDSEQEKALQQILDNQRVLMFALAELGSSLSGSRLTHTAFRDAIRKAASSLREAEKAR